MRGVPFWASFWGAVIVGFGVPIYFLGWLFQLIAGEDFNRWTYGLPSVLSGLVQCIAPIIAIGAAMLFWWVLFHVYEFAKRALLNQHQG